MKSVVQAPELATTDEALGEKAPLMLFDGMDMSTSSRSPRWVARRALLLFLGAMGYL
jgi:hypothetical protein